MRRLHKGGPAARSSSRPLPAEAEVVVARIGTDGDGVAALADGTPVYLPFTLPGERVLAHPFAPLGRGWLAHAARLLETSAERIAPPCPHAGFCGGCALQHWQEAPYRAWKSAGLAAALTHAGFEAPALAPLVAPPPATRRRMDLALKREGGEIRVGLHLPRAGEVVDFQSCLVLAPELFALVAPLRALLGTGKLLRRQGSAVVNLLATGPDLLLRTDLPPGAALGQAERDALVAFARAEGLCRLSWAREGASGEEATPETICQLRIPEITLSGVSARPAPGAFLQASAGGEAAIIAAVRAGLPKLTAKSRIVELFAGCGTLSFALAPLTRIAAYEGSPEAVATLEAAARTAGLSGRVVATRRDLVRRPLVPAEMAGAAAVVLDPPHAGAAAQMPGIVAARPGRVIYVSCNPASLSRDAALLHAAGYRLAASTPIDQFLWSARLESVSVFVC